MKEKIVEIKYNSSKPTIHDGRRIEGGIFLHREEADLCIKVGTDLYNEFVSMVGKYIDDIIEREVTLLDGTTLKVTYNPPVNVDNLSEDIYVQPFDTNEVEILGDTVTLGYQITKEEFEELLRKS